MKLGKLRELIEELPSYYDDCDVIIDAEHSGSEVACSFESNMYYIDYGWYEKALYSEDEIDEELEDEPGQDFKECVVIG